MKLNSNKNKHNLELYFLIKSYTINKIWINYCKKLKKNSILQLNITKVLIKFLVHIKKYLYNQIFLYLLY